MTCKRMSILVSIIFLSLCMTSCATEEPAEDPPAPKQYTSYFTGNQADKNSSPLGGICLMGGATENDEAMRWFLERASGGDVVVLRASGSDGYNNYFYNELGVDVNSVNTIVFRDRSAASDEEVLAAVEKAEALWIAGGDQWDYVSYWRDTPLSDLINNLIRSKGITIGGTSAGMAVLGEYCFTAENGTVTSAEALGNPYSSKVTIGSDRFFDLTLLADTITDTHYDNPDRKGRHTVFLARIITDGGTTGRGIACDEYTAICIDPSGTARVFGGFPDYDDNAYFIIPNDQTTGSTPENCSDGNPLEWNRKGKALKAYQIKGDPSGTGTFNLADWSTGTGGSWKYWFVENGIFKEREK